MPASSPLGKRQELFAQLLSRLILWIPSNPGLAVRFGEGRILRDGAHGTGRKAIDMATKRVVRVSDRVHMEESLHYSGLACDLALFKDGVPLVSGNEPEWRMVGQHWEQMDPLCAWGGRFGDANHFSLAWEGRK